MEQLKYMAAFLLLICVMVPQLQAHNFRYCENPNDYDVNVKALDITPNPVIRGKPLNFSISATTGEAIRGGKMIIIHMDLSGVAVHPKFHDLCSETSCPISAGTDFVISFTETLPETTPTGSYAFIMNLYNENNSRLTCINYDFIITTGSGSGSGSSVAYT